MAAEERREDLLLFFLHGNADEAKLFDHVNRAKEDAELRAAAAEKSLKELIEVQGSLDQQTLLDTLAARAKCERLEKELEELRKVFGNAATVPLDIAKLEEQIRIQHAELEQLRLHRIRHDEVRFPIPRGEGIGRCLIPYLGRECALQRARSAVGKLGGIRKPSCKQDIRSAATGR